MDYGVEAKEISILCDITSAIAIRENQVLYSMTKYIDIHDHFIRDHVEKKNIILEYVCTNK